MKSSNPTARPAWSPQTWPGLIALLALVVVAGLILSGGAFDITGPLHGKIKGRAIMPTLATSPRSGITHYVSWDRYSNTWTARCGRILKVPFEDHQGLNETPKGTMCPKCYQSLLDELLWDASILQNLSMKVK